MTESKADEISAWSVLTLLKKCEWAWTPESYFKVLCPVCEGRKPDHKEGCSFKWHLDRLEIETSGWNPAKIEEDDGA